MGATATSSNGRSWIRRIQRSWVSLLLLMYLVINANMQPSHYLQGGNTLVGGLCSVFRARTMSQPPIDYFNAVPMNAGWKIYHNWDRWNDPTLGDPQAGEITIRHSRVKSASGVWSPVLEEQSDTVQMVDSVTGLPLTNPQQAAAILTAVASHPESLLKPGRIAYYATGGGVTRRVLWKGVANDASVILAATLLVYSLGWVRWRRRTPDGKCPKCGYDLAGLTSRKCPECGVFLADAMEAAAPER